MIEQRQPFRELNHFQLLSFVGIEGNTLPMPESAPPLWRATAAACWEGSPRQRPSFVQLEGVFRAASAEVADGGVLVPAPGGDAESQAADGSTTEGAGEVEDRCAGMAAWGEVASELKSK